MKNKENGDTALRPAEPEAKSKNKHIKTKKLVFLIAAAYAMLAVAGALIVDGRHIRFYMSGAPEMTLEYGQSYQEPGVYAVSAGQLFGEGGKRMEVETSGAPDPSKLGSYTIEYSARYGFHDYTTTRTVTVVDTTPPEISLNHIEGYAPSWLSGYDEEGFSASDSCDGDLTAKVQRSEEPGKIVYTVTDSAGNTATAERPLSSAGSPPVMTMQGAAEMVVTAQTGFSDPGCTAVDADGNDVSSLISVSGEVVPYLAGSYELVYSITNSRGESVSATRTVTVIPVNNPDTVDPDGKTIYLTFDDGPGPYTGSLLDVLAKYNVKVTFFVTASDPRYADMIGRAYREGHGIGVHTCSHNYKAIYSSEDAFFDDFYAMQEIISQQTGSYTSICRFPGGSSNTVSSFNSGIMTRLAAALTDMGYSYFDWNVSSGDAGETTKTAVVAQNIIDGCGARRVSVVLQHDIKDYSVAAVEQVILWGLKNGYTFRALDQSSPTAHHGIAN